MTAFANDRQEMGRIAALEAENEKLWEFVRACAGTQNFGHTPLYVSKARALLEGKRP
jgi:hypothetical protein